MHKKTAALKKALHVDTAGKIFYLQRKIVNLYEVMSIPAGTAL